MTTYVEAGEGGEGDGGGQLYLYTPPGAEKADTFAWYRAGAVLLGSLALDLPVPPDDNLDYLTNLEVVPLPGPAGSTDSAPVLVMPNPSIHPFPASRPPPCLSVCEEASAVAV